MDYYINHLGIRPEKYSVNVNENSRYNTISFIQYFALSLRFHGDNPTLFVIHRSASQHIPVSLTPNCPVWPEQ